MVSALIGSTGFVGGTLMRQTRFDEQFHSTDIETIRGRSSTSSTTARKARTT